MVPCKYRTWMQLWIEKNPQNVTFRNFIFHRATRRISIFVISWKISFVSFTILSYDFIFFQHSFMLEFRNNGIKDPLLWLISQEQKWIPIGWKNLNCFLIGCTEAWETFRLQPQFSYEWWLDDCEKVFCKVFHIFPLLLPCHILIHQSRYLAK